MGRGGKKKKQRQNKSGGNSEKYHILVKSSTIGVRSEWFVVDLKHNKIVMKHPQVVWSGNFFESTAVLQGTTLSVLNICVDDNTKEICLDPHPPKPPIPINNEQDYIHNSGESDTCISTLDLTKTPPEWSKWKPAPKMNLTTVLPFCAALHNDIFVFDGTISNTKNPEVYHISGSGNDDKWEKITGITGITFPVRVLIPPISDPKNNRLIAYFCNEKGDDSLYAYYPKSKECQLIHPHLSSANAFVACSNIADQVIQGNLIVCFHSQEQLFMVYDICINKWLDVDSDKLFTSNGGPHKMYFGCFSKLLHLGNDILCFAIPNELDDVSHFLRFKVKRVDDNHVQLTPLSLLPMSFNNISGSLADTFIPF